MMFGANAHDGRSFATLEFPARIKQKSVAVISVANEHTCIVYSFPKHARPCVHTHLL